jgi:hypothetical protein
MGCSRDRFVRLSASSLARIAATWNLAVWIEIPSRRAITLLEAPSAMAASTSRSRGVSEILAPADVLRQQHNRDDQSFQHGDCPQ